MRIPTLKKLIVYLFQKRNMVTKFALKLFLYFNFLLRFSLGFNIVGYMPEWRHEGADFDRLCQHLTHLIFFSLEMSPKGKTIYIYIYIHKTILKYYLLQVCIHFNVKLFNKIEFYF